MSVPLDHRPQTATKHNQFTVQAEVHHSAPVLEHERHKPVVNGGLDYNNHHHHHHQNPANGRIPAISKPNSYDHFGRPPNSSRDSAVATSSPLSSLTRSLSSYNYSDYEHVLEESQCQVVNFSPVSGGSLVHFYPTTSGHQTASVTDDYYSIDEALSSLDDVLMCATSDLMGDGRSSTSSVRSNWSNNAHNLGRSNSIISLGHLSSYSESDTATTTTASDTNSECSEATCRLGSVEHSEDEEDEEDEETEEEEEDHQSNIDGGGEGEVSEVTLTADTTDHGPTSVSHPRSTSTSKKREFIRRVERFGGDLRDPCLFPLALPMDGSDIYKGATTWESLNLLADCVLSIWTDRSPTTVRAQQRSSKLFGGGHTAVVADPPAFNAWHNPVLTTAFRYTCFQPELGDRFLLHSDVRLPFRRTVSETNLSRLGIDHHTRLVSRPRPQQSLATQRSYGGESLYGSRSMANGHEHRHSKVDDFEDDQVQQQQQQQQQQADDDRDRSRSTLTRYLAAKVTSFKEAKQRKDRFNLNLTKHMRTEARRLAEKNALGTPYKFARRISKLEKRYYRAVGAAEFMALVFKKRSPAMGAELEAMLEFGQELSQLIADLVCAEFTVDDQAQLVANAVETAFTLQQKHNYQSFKSVMRGLQLPEVYRLRNAWKVVQHKYPMHLRVYTYLTLLAAHKADHWLLDPVTPSLPTLAALVDVLRVRCLSIWDRLEDTTGHRPQWTLATAGPAIVRLLAECGGGGDKEADELELDRRVRAKLMGDLEGKLRRWQHQKGAATRASLRFPLKRLLHPESRTMANVLRREQRHSTQIGRDTVTRLAASSLMVESDHIPFEWTLRSLHHLPSCYQMPVIAEFNSVFAQIGAIIEAYKF